LIGRLGRTRTGAISVQVLQEFYVNAVSKIAVRLTPSEARRRLNGFSRWAVHTPAVADVLVATTISEDHQLSFRDAMIIRSASEPGCPILWTEDLNHGQVISGVEIVNPFI
jgi:predicted nucleic acid-binding protein